MRAPRATQPDLTQPDLTPTGHARAGRTSPAAPAPAHDDRAARAVWSALVEPGDEVAGALVAACGAAAALDWVDRSLTGSADWDLLGAGSDLAPPARARLTRALDRWAARRPRVDTPALARAGARAGAHLVVPGDPHWPARLDDLGPAAPFALWVRGEPRAVPTPGVALVGARASTSYGERVAVDLAAGLVAAGLGVVSGGAYGIDAAAHRGALAGDGRTVVVLAGGVDRAYPAGNARLLEEVVRTGGAVVSEVPPGAAPTRSRFLQRNRLIAALADATVVVEAAWRSGAASTAHHAARLLRPVGAVPGPVTSAASAGCHRLVRDGVAVLVTDVAEVLELVGPLDGGPGEEPTRAPGDGLDPVAARVLEHVPRRGALEPGELAARAGSSLAEVRAALGTLELEGLVRRVGAGWAARPRGERGRG